METFEIKKDGCIQKLYANGKFAGIYSEYFGISQFSGNENQIFDVDILVKFLRTLDQEKPIYSSIQNAGNQKYLQVSFRKLILSEGVATIH